MDVKEEDEKVPKGRRKEIAWITIFEVPFQSAQSSSPVALFFFLLTSVARGLFLVYDRGCIEIQQGSRRIEKWSG